VEDSWSRRRRRIAGSEAQHIDFSNQKIGAEEAGPIAAMTLALSICRWMVGKTGNTHCCPKQAVWGGKFAPITGILRGSSRFQKQVGHHGAQMLSKIKACQCALTLHLLDVFKTLF
jgi:hypothetical protein